MKPNIGSGDRGSTRVRAGAADKAECQIDALGDVDELNSTLGLARAQPAGISGDPHIAALLRRIQGELFQVGADLAAAGTPSSRITAADVERLEHDLEAIEAELPALSSFILPAGPGALLHVARAVARRAERRAAELAKEKAVNPAAQAYLNRLSDLLFALARLAARRAGASEEPWKP